MALTQAFFIAHYLEALLPMSAGWMFRITVMASLAAATMLFAAVAGLVSTHGLGNGYGALLASELVLGLAALVGGDGATRLSWQALPEGLALVAIVVITACVLRWRTGGEANRLALQAPSASTAPLATASGLLGIFGLLATIGLGAPLESTLAWVREQSERTTVIAPLMLALVPLWSWLLARPSLLAAPAQQAGLLPPTMADWRRATWLSAYFVLAVALLHRAAASTSLLGDGLSAMLVAAVALDLLAGARAHRRPLVPVAVLHQVQRVAIVEHVLTSAGIPCHLHARHLRSLTAFFAPYAPMIALVPVDRAEEARALLAHVLNAPTAAAAPAQAAEPARPAEPVTERAPVAAPDPRLTSERGGETIAP